MSNSICFYHDPCRSCDGWAAAMGVWTYTKGNVDLVGLGYSADIPHRRYNDSVVYIVDMTPNDIVVIQNLLLECKELHIYDHHIGVKETLDKLQLWAEESRIEEKLKIVFDVERSGARIVWETLLPQTIIPPIIYHIDDYDRWVFKYPTTKAMVAAVTTAPKVPSEWNNNIFNLTSVALLTRGQGILAYQDTLVKSVSKYIRMVSVLGFDVPIVNCPDVIVNEVLDPLTKIHPFAIAYNDQIDQRKYSVRSSNDTTSSNAMCALEVAKHYNGGGHFTAAGFYTPLHNPILGS